MFRKLLIITTVLFLSTLNANAGSDGEFILKKNEKLKFFKNLAKIGYPKIKFIYETKYTKLITKAFQRRFRQELINGITDQECLLISDNIAKKIK